MNLIIKELQERTFTAIASDESIDRDNEIVLSTAWRLDEFKRNPSLMYAHDYKKMPVAVATNIYVDNGRLMLEGKFPPAGVSQDSDTVYGLLKSGVLRTMSVGFRGYDYEFDKQGHKVWKDVSLLEVSFVGVPANTNARVLSVKSHKDIEIDLDAIVWPTKNKNIEINLEAIEFPLEDRLRWKQEKQWAKELEKDMRRN